MKLELQVISDIMSNPNKEGRQKLIKKGALIRKIFDFEKDELEEYIEPKTGKQIKKYSSVCQNNIFYKINTPYEELKEIVLNNPRPILGFMSKSKNYK